MRMQFDVEALTLGNISSHLEAQFQHALKQVVDHFTDESPMLAPNKRAAEISIKLKFSHDLEDRRTDVETELSAKLPKYRRASRHVHLPRGGERFLVEQDEGDQSDLFNFDDTDPKGGVQ